MTAADAGALRALLAKATPGPWVLRPGGGHANPDIVGSESVHTSGRVYTDGAGRVIASSQSFSDVVCEFRSETDLEAPAANAALICAIRNALPSLLDALDSLRSRAEGAEAALIETVMEGCSVYLGKRAVTMIWSPEEQKSVYLLEESGASDRCFDTAADAIDALLRPSGGAGGEVKP